MSDVKMLNNLLRIQLAFQNEDDALEYEVDATNNGYFLNVADGHRSDFIERYGDYPVHIGASFAEARDWIIRNFGVYV